MCKVKIFIIVIVINLKISSIDHKIILNLKLKLQSTITLKYLPKIINGKVL